jgi:DNA-binding response OmpR family regulator
MAFGATSLIGSPVSNDRPIGPAFRTSPSMVKPRILIVASNTQLRAAIARALMAADYSVEVAEDLRRAREAAADAEIALAIVASDELGGADASGELAAEVGQVIMITGASGGGTAPNEIDEKDLLARVKYALRPAAVDEAMGGIETLRFEGYTVDAGGRTCVDAAGQKVSLTGAEFSLLLALARNASKVLSRDELGQAATGRPSAPDDRTVDVLISRLRRKLEPDPKNPRFVLTLPGKGYKFGVRVEAVTLDAMAAGRPRARLEDAAPTAAAIAPAPAITAAATDRRLTLPSYRTLVIPMAAVAVLGCIALLIALLMALWKERAVSVRAFEATTIPLVDDRVRTQLAGYPHEPVAKAIAISREGWGLSSRAANDEIAKGEALARCHERDPSGFCRLYALGDEVVWNGATLTLPLAADIRADAPANASTITPAELAKTWQTIWHAAPPPFAATYLRGADHRALAVNLTSGYRTINRASLAEAIRLAVERCSDLARSPCLLVAVDGVWTAPLPHSHRVIAPFTLASETEMSEAERQRIAKIYADKDWRALAKGRSARWYAVAGRETETAAVDDVLKACRAAEPDCRVHAIGNWRVGGRLELQRD